MKIGRVGNEIVGGAEGGEFGRLAEGGLGVPMTPMVSLAFLLVVFFLLSARLCPPEGDLAMKAGGASHPTADFRQLPTVKIRLKADAKGGLASIAMNERPLKSFDELRAEIRAIVRAAGGSPEVELDCDYQLDYEHTMKAVTSVSGYLAEDGKTPVKLVERVKFAPRRTP